jgi:cytochrome c
MKKFFMIAAVAVAMFSCGGGEKKEAPAAETPKEETKPAEASNPEEDKALALIGQSDCTTCHKINEKLTGPAYMDVAKKYENTEANVNMLVEKVLKGGKGNWGDVPMLGHPTLSKEDATAMVKYILSLNK